jgi:hypothetical protein
MDREKGCGSWIEKESMDESMQGSEFRIEKILPAAHLWRKCFYHRLFLYSPYFEKITEDWQPAGSSQISAKIISPLSIKYLERSPHCH